MARESAAVLLTVGDGCPAAIGRHEFVEVLVDAKSFHVPVAPADCDSLVSWRGELIPVVDLMGLMNDADRQAPPTQHLTLVVAYQARAEEPLRHAGLWLRDYPRAILVNDDQSCELPPEKKNWQEISLCAFSREGTAVPILDLPRIFSATLPLRRPPG